MFNIFRISSGWIMGEIKNDSQEFVFDYSYMTNFLDDMMKVLLVLHGDWAKDEEADKFKATWEPATDVWEMDLEGEIFFIRIKQYQDFECTEYKEEKKFRFDYYEFLNSFNNTMKELLDKYGLLGYRESWGREFPLSLYLKLLDISKKRNIIKLEEISEENNFGLDANRTDIKAEVALMSGELNGKNKIYV